MTQSQDQKTKQPQKGRRYSPAEKQQILADAEEHGVAEGSRRHGCSEWSILRWRKSRDGERASATSSQLAEAAGETGGCLEPLASRAEAQQERRRLILEIWRQQPGLGPSQIRNQLKRKGFKASVNTVREVMEEDGYVQPRLRRREATESYEAVRPLQMVHLDFVHFFIHRLKQCLLLLIDDYSRFIPGWALLKSEHADGVIEAFEAAVARYGKPEGVMTDRGSAFHSWKGLSRFERLLEEYGIDHFLAREARVNGKAERLAAAVQKELVRQVEFADAADAGRQIARWVQFYNYKRTHHSLGGLLVPADRFHGFSEQTLARIERGQGADLDALADPSDRMLELFKVVSAHGKTEVYLMGNRLLG
jgi:transposase InsO family protein